jgi:tRNA(Ile)-lysidine synthase
LAKNVERRFGEQTRDQAWFRPGVRLGVAVSGGADSVALLNLLIELRAELGVVVSAMHFNHKLRGKASETDERFVAKLAEKLGVILHTGRSDVAGKAKREKRIWKMRRDERAMASSNDCGQGVIEVVATAHTMTTKSEVLAHILRGTESQGWLEFIPSQRMQYDHCSVSVARVAEVSAREKQLWREDASNRDTARTRARMRKTPAAVGERIQPSGGGTPLYPTAREQTSFMHRMAEQFFLKYVTLKGTLRESA